MILLREALKKAKAEGRDVSEVLKEHLEASAYITELEKTYGKVSHEDCTPKELEELAEFEELWKKHNLDAKIDLPVDALLKELGLIDDIRFEDFIPEELRRDILEYIEHADDKLRADLYWDNVYSTCSTCGMTDKQIRYVREKYLGLKYEKLNAETFITEDEAAERICKVCKIDPTLTNDVLKAKRRGVTCAQINFFLQADVRHDQMVTYAMLVKHGFTCEEAVQNIRDTLPQENDSDIGRKWDDALKWRRK